MFNCETVKLLLSILTWKICICPIALCLFWSIFLFSFQEKCRAASRQTSSLRPVPCIPTTDELLISSTVVTLKSNTMLYFCLNVVTSTYFLLHWLETVIPLTWRPQLAWYTTVSLWLTDWHPWSPRTFDIRPAGRAVSVPVVQFSNL